MLYRYKPDEGRNARQTGFWLGVGMIFFAAYALRGTLDGMSQGLRTAVGAGDGSPGMEIPILGTTLNPSLFIATGFFLVGAFLWVRFLGKPKTAERLIEVEGEVKKVTWPTFKDASNSTIVVIITVLILMAFLALSDLLLGEFFKVILWNRVI